MHGRAVSPRYSPNSRYVEQEDMVSQSNMYPSGCRRNGRASNQVYFGPPPKRKRYGYQHAQLCLSPGGSLSQKKKLLDLSRLLSFSVLSLARVLVSFILLYVSIRSFQRQISATELRFVSKCRRDPLAVWGNMCKVITAQTHEMDSLTASELSERNENAEHLWNPNGLLLPRRACG